MDPEVTSLPFRLKNPPIVEAILDIDCDLPPDFDLEAIEDAAADHLKEAYPHRQRQSNFDAVDRLQFYSEDRLQVIQFRGNGFSFNRLSPYQTFDEYLPTIAKAWDIFVELASPTVVRKFALRYINSIPIHLKSGNADLNDYFTCGPRSPSGISLRFGGFLHHYLLGNPATEDLANIILTGAEPDGEDTVTATLDIEVFRVKNLEIASFSSYLDLIGELRSLKNDIFKNSLTPSCLESFQQ